MASSSIPGWARRRRARPTRRSSAARPSAGLVEDAKGRVEEWVAERLAKRRTSGRAAHPAALRRALAPNQRAQDDGRRHRRRLHRHHRASSGPRRRCAKPTARRSLRTRSSAKRTRRWRLLSTKLSKYLSPQVYSSIFTGQRNVEIASTRKKLTVFFSDIVDFTATTDDLESEELTGPPQPLPDGDVEDRARAWCDDRQICRRCDPRLLRRPGDAGA